MTLPKLSAVQDVGCLDRLKFQIFLPSPLTDRQADALRSIFEHDDVVYRAFSKIVRGGRDLLSIKRAGCFKMDLVIADTRIIIAFAPTTVGWPEPAMAQVAYAVESCEIGEIEYVAAEREVDPLLAFYGDARMKTLLMVTQEDRLLTAPDISVTKTSRICGSRVTIQACYDAKGSITKIGHSISGCQLMKISASILVLNATGLCVGDILGARKSLDMVLTGFPVEPFWPDLRSLAAVKELTQRHGSALLPFDALIDGLSGRVHSVF